MEIPVYLIIALVVISLSSGYFIMRKPKVLRANSPLSPLHGWEFAEDLREPKYAPWNELLRSKLVNYKDIGIVNLDKDNNYLTEDNDFDSSLNSETDINNFDDYLIKFKANNKLVRYNLDELIFIKWRSPQHSWDHLAGIEGYVVISVKEKRQVDFITTIMN